MEEAYTIFLVISIMYLLLGALYVYIYCKDKYKNLISLISAFILFSGIILFIMGMIIISEKLIISSFFLPLTLFMLSASIELLARYKKCTCVIPAKYVSFTTRGKGQFYAPEFSYVYNGEHFLVYSFVAYGKFRLNRNFTVDETYDIHINPANPTQCVDKRSFPMFCIFSLLLLIVFLIISVIVVLAI